VDQGVEGSNPSPSTNSAAFIGVTPPAPTTISRIDDA